MTNVTQLFPGPIYEVKAAKPKLSDIIEMYKHGSMTADEAMHHIMMHGYMAEALMQVLAN